MTVVDPEGRFLYVNQAARRFLGMPPEECIGRSAFDFVHPDDRARTLEAFRTWCRPAAGRSHSFENRQVSRTGEVRDVSWSITPCTAEDGELLQFASLGKDVSAVRGAEALLAERETRVRALLAGMLDPVVTIDSHGTIQDVSQSARPVFGWEPAELVGRNVNVLMPEPHRSAHDDYLGNYHRTGETHILNRTREFEVVRKDGTRLICDLSVSRVDVPGRNEPLFIGSFRDVTARKRAEQALEERERRFRAIFEQEFQLVALLSPEGAVLEANRAALEAARAERADVIGRPFWETPWWSHSIEARERVRKGIAEAALGGFVRFETTHRRPSGEEVVVDFSLKPIRDERGRVVLLLPEGRDVSHIKQAQLRETAMLRALAAIGESASILVHEVKNPITGIHLALKAVADQLGEDHKVILHDLQDRLQRVERTMRRTLTFAKPLELKRRRVAPSDLLATVGRSLQAELVHSGVTLEIECEPDLPAVGADAALLEDVLANLLKNALEALASGGRVRLVARSAECGRLEVRVEDDGPGIPEHVAAHLFKPFYTTKAKGTGIGLALCKKIVEEHAGEIRAGRSALGGARFDILLPFASAEAEPAT